MRAQGAEPARDGGDQHVLQKAAVVELVGRRQAAAAEHHQLPAVAVVTWRASGSLGPLAVQQGAAHLMSVVVVGGVELLTADLDDPVASHVVVRVGGVQSGGSRK